MSWFFSVSDMDDLMRWWCGGRVGKGRVGGGMGGIGGERRRRKEKEKEEEEEAEWGGYR